MAAVSCNDGCLEVEVRACCPDGLLRGEIIRYAIMKVELICGRSQYLLIRTVTVDDDCAMRSGRTCLRSVLGQI